VLLAQQVLLVPQDHKVFQVHLLASVQQELPGRSVLRLLYREQPDLPEPLVLLVQPVHRRLYRAQQVLLDKQVQQDYLVLLALLALLGLLGLQVQLARKAQQVLLYFLYKTLQTTTIILYHL
jgi:hypothetical protein